MNFTTTNVNINGTSLRGYVTTTWAEIEKVFGAPEEGDGYKVTTEWNIEFADGTVATIYDWKLGYTPSMYDTLNWHIGGKTFDAVDMVKTALAID